MRLSSFARGPAQEGGPFVMREIVPRLVAQSGENGVERNFVLTGGFSSLIAVAAWSDRRARFPSARRSRRDWAVPQLGTS